MEIKPIVRARVVIKGNRGIAEGTVLVDTGATYSIIDEELANEIGVKLLEKPEKVMLRGICCQVEGRLCVIDTLTVEDVTVGPSVAILTELSTEVKEVLRRYEVLNTFILGLRDIIGFTIDVKSGKLKWVGYLAL